MLRDIDLSQPCIPSNYSRLIARELALQTRDVPDLLAMTQLTVDQFLQEDTLLTPQQQLQILDNSVQLANDDAFGLRLGRRLTSPTHGAMGFLVNSSPDLLTAIRAFQAFLPTRMNLARLTVVTRSKELRLTCQLPSDLPEPLVRLLSESFAVIFFDSAEFIVGRPVEEAVCQFLHARPDYGSRYSEFIPCSMAFGARELGLRLPLKVCQAPNASANHENYMMALGQCEAMLAKLRPDSASYRYRLQKMMLSHPPGVLSEEEAAAALFVCKRTLARKLKNEGTSFRQVRDCVLSEQAARHLRDSTLSIEAIAALLNYHDGANFRRAFKRWFGQTPDEYRSRPVRS